MRALALACAAFALMSGCATPTPGDGPAADSGVGDGDRSRDGAPGGDAAAAGGVVANANATADAASRPMVVDWEGAFSGPDLHLCVAGGCGGAGFGWFEDSNHLEVPAAEVWSFDLTLEWDASHGNAELHVAAGFADRQGRDRIVPVGEQEDMQGPGPIRLQGIVTGAAAADLFAMRVSAPHHGTGDTWAAYAPGGQPFHVTGTLTPGP